MRRASGQVLLFHRKWMCTAVFWKLDILVDQVLNVEFFLHETHRFTSEDFINPPGAAWSTFIMDGWTLMDLTAIHCHYKPWKSHAGHFLIH